MTKELLFEVISPTDGSSLYQRLPAAACTLSKKAKRYFVFAR